MNKIQYLLKSYSEAEDTYKYIKFANKKFKTQDSDISIVFNILKELELIFGKKSMLNSYELEYRIDQIMNKKGYGKSLSEDIVRLSYLVDSLTDGIQDIHKQKEIINTKLLPLFEKLKFTTLTDEEKNKVLLQIEKKNFDTKPLLKILALNVFEFTKEEIDNIKESIHIFNRFEENYLFSAKNLCLNYPETNYEEIEVDKVSFINKYITMYNFNVEVYEFKNFEFEQLWNKINTKILFELIPQYIKKNKHEKIDLPKIAELSRYETTYSAYDLSQKSKYQKIKRRIEK